MNFKKIEDNSDEHYGVIGILFELTPRIKSIEKVQKSCILIFQDAIIKVLQKLKF